MTSVFFDVGISLDGFLAGPNRGPANPLGDRGTTSHEWMFRTAASRELLATSGGERGIAAFVRERLVDDFTLHVAPVLLGSGVPLFDGIGPEHLAPSRAETIAAPQGTHMRFYAR
jgi:dihydrofolate reductase